MNPTVNSAKNVLGSDVEITGNIKFAGELAFDGKLEGEVTSDGNLNIGENATINGDVNVAAVVLRGKVTGNVNARDKVELKANSELFGDVRAAKLVVEEGVTFVGKIDVNPNKVAPSAAKPAAKFDLPKVATTTSSKTVAV
jgi:cytoskeletal protein CcmA (bactofilin family)